MQRVAVARQVFEVVVAHVVEDHHAAGAGLDFEVELWKNRAAAVLDLVEVHQRGHEPLAAFAVVGALVLMTAVIGWIVGQDLMRPGSAPRDRS